MDSLLGRLRATLDAPAASDVERLRRANRLLLRSAVGEVTDRLLRHFGPTVQSGPFQGMRFATQSAEGCYAPKLLGCYEQELHPVIARTPRRGYRQVINIGCAEGYYAVGLARLLPQARVHAFDTNPAAQTLCAKLATLNGVADRIITGSTVDGAAIGRLIDGPTLIVCDCEGCEYAVLDPLATPALAMADLIVELHGTRGDAARGNAFVDRFRPTHQVQVIPHAGRDPATIPGIAMLSQLEQFYATWETRSEPTPWAVLQANRA